MTMTPTGPGRRARGRKGRLPYRVGREQVGQAIGIPAQG